LQRRIISDTWLALGFEGLLRFSPCRVFIMDDHIALVSINKNVVLLKDVLDVSKRVSLAFRVR
jgi:hypothetical protein